ncbi:hypothetical protein [uncultured Sphingomonas sp.]|uniref:hypothetical protein n=1 Tax=Sphingomonas sp. TaxID=28214 RepID=UPI00262E20B7|nr:hypothetical protein [uncultured Sphingomonas sp.]
MTKPRDPQTGPDRIVAIGLLTQRDLDVLGSGFRRSFSVEDDHAFADLLEALDEIEEVSVTLPPD